MIDAHPTGGITPGGLDPTTGAASGPIGPDAPYGKPF